LSHEGSKTVFVFVQHISRIQTWTALVSMSRGKLHTESPVGCNVIDNTESTARWILTMRSHSYGQERPAPPRGIIYQFWSDWSFSV